MRLVAERTKICYVPNDPDGGTIEIRNLSEEDCARIESKYLKVGEKGAEISGYADRDADYARSSLKGFDNMFDEKGNPLKFSPKNIEKVSHLSIVITNDDGTESTKRFFEWVNEERETFAEEVAAQEADSRKNS